MDSTFTRSHDALSEGGRCPFSCCEMGRGRPLSERRAVLVVVIRVDHPIPFFARRRDRKNPTPQRALGGLYFQTMPGNQPRRLVSDKRAIGENAGNFIEVGDFRAAPLPGAPRLPSLRAQALPELLSPSTSMEASVPSLLSGMLGLTR